MEGFVFLNNLRFYSYHGVGAQEMQVGNEFTVSLKLRTDLLQAMQTDEVADTVNYADIFNAVKDEMSRPSKLLEHVGGRILGRLFHDFPAIEAVELELAKRNPPMGADVEACGIQLACTREEWSRRT